jgi:hypothetical protein
MTKADPRQLGLFDTPGTLLQDLIETHARKTEVQPETIPLDLDPQLAHEFYLDINERPVKGDTVNARVINATLQIKRDMRAVKDPRITQEQRDFFNSRITMFRASIKKLLQK